MKIEDQVCSLELAKRLKELGVKQESYFYWERCPEQNNKICLWSNEHHQMWADEFVSFHLIEDQENYSAFTVAELVEILPVYSEGYNSLHINKYIHEYEVTYNDSRSETFYKKDTKLADCLAKTLIHLIENGYVKAEDL